MNVCVLFILYSGWGYVTPACYTSHGLLEPQDVVYVQHLNSGWNLWDAPDEYVDCYRSRRRHVRHVHRYRAPMRGLKITHWGQNHHGYSHHRRFKRRAHRHHNRVRHNRGHRQRHNAKARLNIRINGGNVVINRYNNSSARRSHRSGARRQGTNRGHRRKHRHRRHRRH